MFGGHDERCAVFKSAPDGGPSQEPCVLPVFDRAVVSQVTVLRTNRAHHNSREGWVWTYLRACLACAVGYDEAREIVDDVREDTLEGVTRA